MIIHAQKVTKHYRSVTAVQSVSLSAQPGQILALLGPNGAGKSSLIRILTGLIAPDEGRLIVLDGEQEYRYVPEQHLGYLPEDRGLYREKTLRQNLRYIGALRAMPKPLRNERINYWLDYFELTARADEPLSRLSKGNQQKVQLIATLLHDPKVIILDEPFSGLDPVNQEQVLNLLCELRDQNRLILLSAHQMALVERIADQMLLLDLGQCIATGSLQEVKAQLGEQQTYSATLANEAQCQRARRALSELPGLMVSAPDSPPETSATDTLDSESMTAENMATTKSAAIVQFALSSPEQLSPALQRLSAQATVLSLDRRTTSLHQLYLQSIRQRRASGTEEAQP